MNKAMRIRKRRALSLLLCVCMLLGTLSTGMYYILSHVHAASDDGIMPLARETVNVNIASLNFNNNNMFTGGRLRNAFQNGITATLRGNYTNNIYYNIGNLIFIFTVIVRSKCLKKFNADCLRTIV